MVWESKNTSTLDIPLRGIAVILVRFAKRIQAISNDITDHTDVLQIAPKIAWSSDPIEWQSPIKLSAGLQNQYLNITPVLSKLSRIRSSYGHASVPTAIQRAAKLASGLSEDNNYYGGDEADNISPNLTVQSAVIIAMCDVCRDASMIAYFADDVIGTIKTIIQTLKGVITARGCQIIENLLAIEIEKIKRLADTPFLSLGQPIDPSEQGPLGDIWPEGKKFSEVQIDRSTIVGAVESQSVPGNFPIEKFAGIGRRLTWADLM